MGHYSAFPQQLGRHDPLHHGIAEFGVDGSRHVADGAGWRALPSVQGNGRRGLAYRMHVGWN
jgi:hypothetical protein